MKAASETTAPWKTAFASLNRCLEVEPPGLEFSCNELKYFARRGVDRLMSIASSSLCRTGRFPLSPAHVKLAAESAHGEDELLSVGTPDDEAILIMLWGTQPRCASLLHLHSLALRVLADSQAMAAMDAKERSHYAILHRSLGSMLATVLETANCQEGARMSRMRNAAFTAAAVAVRMDTLANCSRLLAIARTSNPPLLETADLAALARLTYSFLHIASEMLKSTAISGVNAGASGIAATAAAAGAAASAWPPLEAVMNALVNSGIVEQSASVLVRAALAAKPRNGESQLASVGSRADGRSANELMPSSSKDLGGPRKHGNGGGSSRRSRGAAAAASGTPAPQAARTRTDAGIIIAGFVATFLSSAYVPLVELIDTRHTLEKAGGNSESAGIDSALESRVSGSARAILSGPCFQYAMAAHVVAQLATADGGALYGLSEATMLPCCVTETGDTHRGTPAPTARQAAIHWAGMRAAARLWFWCFKASPQVPLSPYGRCSVHALSMRMVRLAIQSALRVGTASGGNVQRVASARAAASHSSEHQPPPGVVLPRNAVVGLGLEALRCAAATCPAQPALYCYPWRGDGDPWRSPAGISPRAAAAVAEWWSVAVPLCHFALSQEASLPRHFQELFCLTIDCWPAGDLPPVPPVNLAMAMRAGFLPLLERAMRVQQRATDHPITTCLLLSSLCDWQLTGRLLAYGQLSEAAALVATAGKLAQRLFNVCPATLIPIWVEGLGGHAADGVTDRISSGLLTRMHNWLHNYSMVLLSRHDVEAVRSGAVSCNSSGSTGVHVRPAAKMGIDVMCCCERCRGSPCFSAYWATHGSSCEGASRAVDSSVSSDLSSSDSGGSGAGGGGNRAVSPATPCDGCRATPGSGDELEGFSAFVNGSSGGASGDGGGSDSDSGGSRNGEGEDGSGSGCSFSSDCEDDDASECSDAFVGGSGGCSTSADDGAVGSGTISPSGPFMVWQGGPSAQLLQLVPFAVRQWLPPMANFVCQSPAVQGTAPANAAAPRHPLNGCPHRDLSHAISLLAVQLRVADVVVTWIPALVAAHAMASLRMMSPFALSTVAFAAGGGAAAAAMPGGVGTASAATRLRQLLLSELDVLHMLGVTLSRIDAASTGDAAAAAAAAKVGVSDVSDLLNRIYVSLECLAAEFPGEVSAALRDGTLPRVTERARALRPARQAGGPTQTTATWIAGTFPAEEGSLDLRAGLVERLLQLQRMAPSTAAFWRVPLGCTTFWCPEMRLAEMGSALVLGMLAFEPPVPAPATPHARAATVAATVAAAAEAAGPVLRTCGNPACTNLDGDSEATVRLRACSGCGRVSYCGSECQKAHWRAGHRSDCAGRRQEEGSGAGGFEPSRDGAGDGAAAAARGDLGSGHQEKQRRRACEHWWG